MTWKDKLEEAKTALASGDIELTDRLVKEANSAKHIAKLEEIAGPQVDETADALKAIADRLEAIEKQPATVPPVQVEAKGAPTVLKIGRGDDETKAWAHWAKTGDDGGIKSLKASNDTDMNVGTDADGGYAVPTGHHSAIIARLDEQALYGPLGVQMIPGIGTTVNVPIDNEADGEFVSTAEAGAFDRDAPALGQAAMTLVKYTKKVEMSYELLEDEASNIMTFLADFAGRGLAKTHNSLLVTEALASGTAALTLDSATVVAVSEIPELVYLLPGEYFGGSSWLLNRAVEGEIRANVGENFQFVPTPQGGVNSELWGRPVYNSASMGLTAASVKSLVLGNFAYMGLRMSPEITVLRDPYSKAANGQIVFHYYSRIVYKVLVAEAIIYATHPSA